MASIALHRAGLGWVMYFVLGALLWDTLFALLSRVLPSPFRCKDLLEWLRRSFLHAPEGLDPLLTVRDLIVQPLDLLSEDADPFPHLLDQLETPLHHRPRDEGPFISRVPGVPEEVDRPPVPLPAKPCPHHDLLKDLQQHVTSGRVEHSGKLLEQVIECQQEDQRSDRLYRLRQEAEVLR